MSDAIVIKNVTKSFKKHALRKDHTTFKTELINFVLRRRSKRPVHQIPALQGVDLTIERGKTIGIIGRNGSGKSTLLKLITGIYSPTSGEMQVNGRISALLDLGAGFHPDFSGRENILINGIILGMSRREVKARTQAIIDFAELGDFIDEPVRTYSSGMYMRLAFSVATHVEPDILIVDEILAVGDEHFTKKSRAKMLEFKSSGKTIVLVSHELGNLEKWCDQVAWLDGGRIRELGNPREVVQHYREAVALAEKQANDGQTSALSAPGLPLPATAPETKTPDPLRVEVHSAPGKPLDALTSDATLTVSITGALASPDLSGIEVRVRRSDGVLALKAAAPKALVGASSLQLRIERLGLASGTYQLEAARLNGKGEPVGVSPPVVLTVVPGMAEGGLAAPPLQWDALSDERAGSPPGEARPAGRALA